MERLGPLGATRAPVGEETQGRCQVEAIRCQGVRHPRGSLLVRRGDNDPLTLEPAQPVGEDVRSDRGECLGQLVEPSPAIKQRLDEQQAPAVADPVQGGLERGRRWARGGGVRHGLDGRAGFGACHGRLSVVDCKLQVYRTKPNQ